jgi:hypothetical protein
MNHSATGRKKAQSVSWGSVEIREYSIVLTTTPATRVGPPIGLGWEYRCEANVEVLRRSQDEGGGAIAIGPYSIEGGRTTVDFYESLRSSELRHPEVLRDLYLNSFEREAMLQKRNYKHDDIRQAMQKQVHEVHVRVRSKNHLTGWKRSKPKRIRKIKRAIKNLQQREIPRNIYAFWWLPLEISL